jgi:hypothetical protein
MSEAARAYLQLQRLSRHQTLQGFGDHFQHIHACDDAHRLLPLSHDQPVNVLIDHHPSRFRLRRP